MSLRVAIIVFPSPLCLGLILSYVLDFEIRLGFVSDTIYFFNDLFYAIYF